MRRRGLAAIAALVAVTGAVAGCGGGDDDATQSAVSWTRQADAICAEAASRYAQLPEQLGLDSDSPVRRQEREILSSKLEQLRSVDVPDDVAKDFERMVELQEQESRAFEKFLVAASDPGDAEARARSVGFLREQKRLGEESVEIARDLRLEGCAGG